MLYDPTYATTCGHDLSFVLQRIDTLCALDAAEKMERQRIQQIMDGGVGGIHAVMAWHLGRQGSQSWDDLRNNFGVDLPAVNLMASGSDRLAQELGDMPRLKPAIAATREIREKLMARAQIVCDWDEMCELELQFPQIARWLPGYTYYAQFITWGRMADGTPFPKVELRDSYDVYCGWYGGASEPDDLVTKRTVPLYALERIYPTEYSGISWSRVHERLKESRKKPLEASRVDAASSTQPRGRADTYEGPTTGVEVCEYWDHRGCSTTIPELSIPLTFYENPLASGPSYVVGRKYSFNKNISQYHHVVGLVSMMAKLNIIGLVASEDSVFRETNVIGEMEGKVYRRGRFAVNTFLPGTLIDRPTGDMPQALWAQIDRLERQLRIGAAYDVSSDGISPNSFATGAAVEQLASGRERVIAEYHKVMRRATIRLDQRRLEWAEALWPNKRTRIFYGSGKRTTYRPSKDIKGEYVTRRVYAPGGLWGSNQQGIMGLQLLQGEVIDRVVMQDALPGIGEDGEEIFARIDANKAKQALLSRIVSSPPGQFTPGPAEAMLIEIMQTPEDMEDIVAKWASPQEPQLSPEEQAFAQQAAMGGMAGGGPPALGPGGPPGAPPGAGGQAPEGIAEMLAMLENEAQTTTMSQATTGGNEAGVQTVGRL